MIWHGCLPPSTGVMLVSGSRGVVQLVQQLQHIAGQRLGTCRREGAEQGSRYTLRWTQRAMKRRFGSLAGADPSVFG